MREKKSKIRPSYLAGCWFPEDPQKLRESVSMLLKSQEKTFNPHSVQGLISPHSGYDFSGPVAAKAFQYVMDRDYDTVIIIGPNHNDPLLTFTSVLTSGAYQTPLGTVPIDRETAESIVNHRDRDGIKEYDSVHFKSPMKDPEHSIEIQIPFLQVALGDFKIVPVIMGNRDDGRKSCSELAAALYPVLKDKRTLIVASTDLSHHQPAEVQKTMDLAFKARVNEYNPTGLLQDLEAGRIEACGGLPVSAMMMACRYYGDVNAKVVGFSNSREVNDQIEGLVGYLSAVVSLGPPSGETTPQRGAPQ